MRKPAKANLGDLLVKSLTELRDGLRGRTGKLTVKTVEIPKPPDRPRTEPASVVHCSKR